MLLLRILNNVAALMIMATTTIHGLLVASAFLSVLAVGGLLDRWGVSPFLLFGIALVILAFVTFLVLIVVPMTMIDVEDDHD